MKLNMMTTAIIVGLICLVGGLVLGYMLGISRVEEKKVTDEERSEDAILLLKIGKSALLDHMSAQLQGEVAEIDENSLLIKKGDDSLKVETGDFLRHVARIRLIEDRREVDEVKWQDIKIGDRVIVNCMLSAERCQVMGVTIDEMPPPEEPEEEEIIKEE